MVKQRSGMALRDAVMLGFVGHAIQSYLAFMALNLKRLVKLLTGVSFRGEAGACFIGS